MADRTHRQATGIYKKNPERVKPVAGLLKELDKIEE
jgi:hypothetical protein